MGYWKTLQGFKTLEGLGHDSMNQKVLDAQQSLADVYAYFEKQIQPPQPFLYSSDSGEMLVCSEYHIDSPISMPQPTKKC